MDRNSIWVPIIWALLLAGPIIIHIAIETVKGVRTMPKTIIMDKFVVTPKESTLIDVLEKEKRYRFDSQQGAERFIRFLRRQGISQDLVIVPVHYDFGEPIEVPEEGE